MRELLERWREGATSRDEERELIRLHVHYFRRRVARLGSRWFLGAEHSPEAIESLAQDAFEAFGREPFRNGQSAFEYALSNRFANPIGILYYWRGSATFEYLERKGSPLLEARRQLRLNVIDALREHVMSSETEGRPRYGAYRLEGRELDDLVLPPGLRGAPEAVQLVLSQTRRPVTADEVCDVVELNATFPIARTETPGRREAAPESAADVAESARRQSDLSDRVRRYFEALDGDERLLLARRGFGQGEAGLVSFEAVREKDDGQPDEELRQRERGIIERFRVLLAPGELSAAVEILGRLVRRHALRSVDVAAPEPDKEEEHS